MSDKLAVINDEYNRPVALVRRPSSLALQRKESAPCGITSQANLGLQGCKRVRIPKRTIYKKYGIFGNLKEEVITEEMFEADFFDLDFSSFEE